MGKEGLGASRTRVLVVALAFLPAAMGLGCSDDRSAKLEGGDPAAAAGAASGEVALDARSDATGSASTSTSPMVRSRPPSNSAAAAGTALPDASEAPRTAPGVGAGTALLQAVRVGRSDGYERIVFEFVGESRPGYRIAWVDGPVVADGSGSVVDIPGSAHLQVIMEPGSGVDMADGTVHYKGPDRVEVDDKVELIESLVRTGDFESVLTWVAGTDHTARFRVLTLSEPTRLVIDLDTRR